MKEAKYEHGTIDDKGYIAPFGSERIDFGSEVSLVFLGGPNNFPKPWVFRSAEMVYTTVCYDYIVYAVIEASNGNKITLDDFRTYSPHNVK